MSNFSATFVRTYFVPAHEGDGDGGGGAAGGNASGAGDNPFADWKDGDKIPSALQEQLNSVIAREKKKHQDALSGMQSEVESMSKRADLTAKERQQLAQRLDEVQEKLLTQEELSRKKQEEAAAAAAAQLESLTVERDAWKKQFTDSLITNKILAAAESEQAFNGSQITTLLKPAAEVYEVIQDEEPTGQYDVRIKLPGKDKKGEDITLSLNADEAVKHIKGMSEHANLFRSDGSGGLGGGTGSGGKPVDEAELSKDPASYRQNRSKLLNG